MHLALARLLAVCSAVALGLASSASAAVYWANHTSPPFVYDEDSIGRANLDGSVVNQSFIFGARGPCGVAVDGGYIYWANSNPAGNTIGSANLDGSEVDESFIRGGVAPCGLAVDEDNVYWANTAGGDSIARASILGAAPPEEAFIPGGSGPSAVAVDKQFVYWTNSGQNTSNTTYANTIGRAKLDGTEVKQNFITGASTPRGMAVDGAHIYWANSTTGTIGRANLDGSGSDQEFVTGAGQPCGVAVDGSHIYWADRAHGTIGRANLDGTGADDSFITGASEPCGVAVDSVVVPPAPVITSPASGAVYTQGQTVAADYICGPPTGVSLTACIGPVANGAAIDTNALGMHRFIVIASDSDGVSEFEEAVYTVVTRPAAKPPTPRRTPNNAFVSSTPKVEPDGTIVLSERSSDPGTFTAVAMTSRGYLARATNPAAPLSARAARCKHARIKKCKTPHPKVAPALYGAGSATSAGAGSVQLTIKPNSRSRAALASGRTLHVKISITFQSSIGGGATTAVRKATVKGATRRHKHR